MKTPQTSLNYLPAHFEETDPATQQALVSSYPLATWVVQHDGQLLVNQIPFLLDPDRGEHGTLLAHVARANPVWQCLTAPSVVVFQGPQAYISPNWYPGKQVHGKAVPTWNYATVQAHGVPQAFEDPARLLALVTRLTQIHEATQPSPWQVSDAPADYLEKMLKAIVGIEIPVQHWIGKWKTSQNRPLADRQGVAAGLSTLHCPHALAMAALVQRNRTP